MQAKRFAVVTASNAVCGDFLTRHWLPSVCDHVDRSQIDVVVLDYGLTEAQRAVLDAAGARRRLCIDDGFVGILRFRDVARMLDDAPYERLLVCDGGDLIFQADVGSLFAAGRPALEAVAEQFATPFFDTLVNHADVRPELVEAIREFVDGRPMLNVGVVVGTADMFRALWAEYGKWCREFQCYGIDQLVFNYFAYMHGVHVLDTGYNFVLLTAVQRYDVRNGTFYDHCGRVIPIVHNVASRFGLAVVSRFGYGPDRNRPLRWKMKALQWGMIGLRSWFGLRRRVAAGLRRATGDRDAAASRSAEIPANST